MIHAVGTAVSLALLFVLATFGTPDPVSSVTVPEGRRSQEFAVDPLHSSVLFRVQHLRAAPFWGRFNAIEGSFRVDPENPTESFVKVTIPVDSVDTGNAKRDAHLESGDFFSMKEFPTIRLESTRIEAAGDDRWTMTADLTLRGVTRSVDVDVVHTGTAEISPRFGLRSGYEATFTLDRTNFGMDYYVEQGVLGKDIRVTVAIEGMLPE